MKTAPSKNAPPSDPVSSELVGRSSVRFRRVRCVLGAIQTVWTAFGVALALLLLIELPLERLLGRARLYTRADLEPNLPGMTDDFYRTFGYEMQQTCFQRGSVRWQPYCYSRNVPFAGEYIQIDENGLRKSWNAATDAKSTATRPLKIFFFGGSAMWGWGARDDFTIPSLVAKQLADEGLPVEVTNYAQRAYVSTQNVIALQEELERGARPDLVIFFDGFNEIASSYANQATGLSLFERDRELEFDIVGKPATQLFRFALANTAIGQIVLDSAAGRLRTPERRWSSREAMAADIVQRYTNNIQVCQALSKSFGFDVVYYWQPSIYEKRVLSTAEQGYIDDLEFVNDPEKMTDIWRKVYAAAKALCDRANRPDVTGAPRLSYLGDLFNTTAWDGKTAFCDRAHLGEAGNQAVAEEMTKAVRPLLKGQMSKPPQ